MKMHRMLLVATALAVVVAATSALVAEAAGSNGATVVKTKKTSLGTILVTSAGRSLYLDSADRRGHPVCTGNCLKFWPPLKASGKLKAAGSAKTADLGTIKIAGHIKQVTYAGHPLYTFLSDKQSGQTSGEGENGFYLVSPSGRKIAKPASATSPTTTSPTTTSPTTSTPTSTSPTTTAPTTTSPTTTAPTTTSPTTTYPTTTYLYVYASPARQAMTHAQAMSTAFLGSLHLSTIGSTVPSNGDVNPYGLAVVPASVGSLTAGDYLISNFNAKSNNQGTGTTIVEMTPGGRLSLFAALKARQLPGSCPGGVGLTTALSVLPGGYVVVGSLPTTNGKSATARSGCLIVLNSHGQAVETIAGSKIQGPWDMTSATDGSTTTLFVSNVLNGGAAAGTSTIDNSTVVRIRLSTAHGHAPKVQSEQVIADRIPWRDDKAALVIGPTGLALAKDGTLYVADTLESRIIAIPNAMSRNKALPDRGLTLASGGHLNQPLGLTIAPNGDILTTNAGDGNIVETTPSGHQIAIATGDAKTGAGSLFGLAIAPGGRGLLYVDDGTNTLRLLH